MKKTVNKSLRLVLICVVIVLAGVVSFLLFREFKDPGFVEEKVSLYRYTNQSDVTYKAVLKPNVLYDGDSLGEGEVYITEFVDYIKAFPSYQFTGEQDADIKGEYEVMAVVEGYTGEGENYNTIWRKGFSYIPKTPFEFKGKEFSLAKDVTLNLAEYNNFVTAVIESSKVSSQVKLSVVMNVNLMADTDKGLVETTASPSIVIPLNQNSFEITKMQTMEKPEPGALEETQKVQQPVDKRAAIVYSVLLAVLIIALVYLFLFTTGEDKEPLIKHLDAIFKKHGSRLVALNSEIEHSNGEQYKVRSIEDLVRVADEIGKPIMYKHSHDPQSINCFYVFDDDGMYVFDLKDYLNELEMEKVPKDTGKPQGKESHTEIVDPGDSQQKDINL